ncbi:anti-sigma factor domain-containing protein [Paenibacillus wenxiniae]|uniref:Regulator of SigK n=1 Tax=Paenibacillus wenxiniae TaxID=1636843 RepID=A0ABW4REQ9_9BACL
MNNEHEHNEWMDMVEMYVLGGLDREEQERFEAYMKQNKECRLAVEEFREVVGFLPLSVERIEPPQGMKNRILERVFAEGKQDGGQARSVASTATLSEAPRATLASAMPAQASQSERTMPTATETSATTPLRTEKTTVGRRSSARNRATLWQMTTAIAVAAAVLIGMYASNLRGEIGNLQQQLAMTSDEMGNLQQKIVSASMPSQGLRVNEAVKLSPAAKDIVAQGLATIVIDAKGTHLLVQADKLPQLKGSQAFQVWLIKGDVKQSAGTFLTRDGTGAMYYTFKPDDYDTVAITLEPDEKGSQPRGPVILAASIADQG